MKKRLFPLLLAGVPIALVIGLLIWATVDQSEQSGRPGVNSEFGVVTSTAPDGVSFLLPLVGGGELDLMDQRGKVVVVDFWSSWCPPCNAEAPIIADAYAKWSGRGVEFVGVAIWDTEEDVREFIDRHRIGYPVVIDARGRATVEFGVSGIPEKFFILPDGSIAKKVVGPSTPEDFDRIIGEVTDQALGILPSP